MRHELIANFTYLGGSTACFARGFLGGGLPLTDLKFNTLNSEKKARKRLTLEKSNIGIIFTYLHRQGVLKPFALIILKAYLSSLPNF